MTRLAKYSLNTVQLHSAYRHSGGGGRLRRLTPRATPARIAQEPPSSLLTVNRHAL